MKRKLRLGFILFVVIAMTGITGKKNYAGAEEITDAIPFGINNPFKHPESDEGSDACLQNHSSPLSQPTYAERHIKPNDLIDCLPKASAYMDNIKDIGVNVISQHFRRRYKDGLPYFGLEEKGHNNHEIAVQLYINAYDNYFWAAVNPASEKCFIGDIDVDRHQVVKTQRQLNKAKECVPYSEEGFAKWREWLSAMFDYLDDHGATDRLLYIQLGNESDRDYAKKDKADAANRDDYHWHAYARLIEESYGLIKGRSPDVKIAVGTLAGGGISLEGFQRPFLEYLAGIIDEQGNCLTGETDGSGNCQMPSGWPAENRLCYGAGCFDAYDYHDFSAYQQYQGKEFVRKGIHIIKGPGTFGELLRSTGFADKKLVVQQGGTYTGYDDKDYGGGRRITQYQTEEDQASYLVKRAVHLVSNGVEETQFATYVEHSCYKGTIHNWFTLMGLTYNGIAVQGEVPYCQKKDPEPVNFRKRTCDGQFPCSDPGKDVKKLSYFSYKKLIETLKGSDWKDTETVDTGDEGTFMYKFTKNSTAENSVYVAWWDWWKGCARVDETIEQCKANNDPDDHSVIESCVNHSNDSCIAANKPVIVLDAAAVKVTEAVPRDTVGARVGDYGEAFNTFEIRDADDGIEDGRVSIPLGKKPVYFEVTESAPVDKPPVVTITDPAEGAVVHGTITVKAEASDDVGIERVEFYVDDAVLKNTSYGTSRAEIQYEVPLDTINYSNSSHTLKVKAVDTKGQAQEDTGGITVANPAGNVTASPNPCVLPPGNGTHCNTTVSWETENAPGACIFMRESGKLYACAASGSAETPGIGIAGITFELHSQKDINSLLLASVFVKGEIVPRQLTVFKSGNGTGTLSSYPAGITCDPSCESTSNNFHLESSVWIKAEPSADSEFGGWGSSPCSQVFSHEVYGEWCQVVMDADKSVTAAFDCATTIRIVDLQDGGTVAAGATVKIEAVVSGCEEIIGVKFYINNMDRVRKFDRRSPYVYRWDVPRKRGRVHTIKVEAYTAQGVAATQSIQVTSQ